MANGPAPSTRYTTWLNGTVIGRTNQFGVPRRYRIEAGIAKPGTNTITLRVTNAGGGGILADPHPLRIHPEGEAAAAITLAGKWRLQETAKLKDRQFVWAQAVIDGDSIVVSSPAVPQPVAVRYGWDANPEACLYNGAGLPAVPFRSDDWPGTVAR